VLAGIGVFVNIVVRNFRFIYPEKLKNIVLGSVLVLLPNGLSRK
jgi:hypothetical protein